MSQALETGEMETREGASGLIFNEALLWERGRKGRCGFSMPRRDVESLPPENNTDARLPSG